MDLLFNIFVLKCMDRDLRSNVVMERLGTIYAGLEAASRIRLAFEMQSSENFNALLSKVSQPSNVLLTFTFKLCLMSLIG